MIFEEIKTNETEYITKEVSEKDMDLIIRYSEMSINDIPFLTDEVLFKPIFDEELNPNEFKVLFQDEI